MARGSNLLTLKIDINDTTDFTETLDFTVLHCNNFSGNNNKFYCIEIQKNPKTSELRLFSHYGRLGHSNVYEIRDKWKATKANVREAEQSRIEDEYKAIISKKESGKSVTKGSTQINEFYTKVDVLSPSVGSLNIRNKSVVSFKKIITEVEGVSDPLVTQLLAQLVLDNIHEITAKTSFKFTSSGIETDIGPVSESHLIKAKKVLDQLGDLIKRKNNVTDINNLYFSMIPHKFKGALKVDDMISTADVLSKEYDLLEDLLSAVQLGLSKDDSIDEEKLKLNLKVMDKNSQWKIIDKSFNSTRHKQHLNLNKWKINRIFEVGEKPDKLVEYADIKNKIGNEMEFFHGTRNSNVLSILFNGLMIPPSSAGFVTGRMFGDGIYGATCSTKALNYATGYWSGGAEPDTTYVFVTKFVMGKVQKLKNFQYSGADNGFDSVHGLSGENGGSLLNDEYIVYNKKQAIITHLIELRK